MKFNDIEIEWKGHAGFFISNSKKIYIDPYKLKPGAEKADIVLITHSHYDHCSIQDLSRIVQNGTVIVMPADCSSKLAKLSEKLDIKVIEPGQEIDIGNITVKAVPAYNTNKQYHSKSEYWNGYVLSVEGIRIYHSGDTDLIPEMSDLDDIDIALLSVGGTYTMTAEEASRAAILIRPKKAIPMHYGSDIVGTREDAERFVDLCKGEGVEAEVLEIN